MHDEALAFVHPRIKRSTGSAPLLSEAIQRTALGRHARRRCELPSPAPVVGRSSASASFAPSGPRAPARRKARMGAEAAAERLAAIISQAARYAVLSPGGAQRVRMIAASAHVRCKHFKISHRRWHRRRLTAGPVASAGSSPMRTSQPAGLADLPIAPRCRWRRALPEGISQLAIRAQALAACRRDAGPRAARAKRSQQFGAAPARNASTRGEVVGRPCSSVSMVAFPERRRRATKACVAMRALKRWP
jgi:hypothetical protein